MAEGESDSESERLGEQLDHLQVRQPECKSYCSGFCELVTEHTGRWRVPLPRLQVLRTALCRFCLSSASFPPGCEPVHCTLSSLALSFFELLLFFGKEEFLESPLRDILNSFQECHSHLARHHNIYLLLVRQVIEGGGPWEPPVLQVILRDAEQPQAEVEKYLSSEVPIFFELRVRYLLACSRTQEAIALAKCCLEHPELGKHLYFHQAYLTCLWKASHYDHLQKGIALIDGRDAVEIICNCESEEKDELLLALSKAFLTHQLRNGDMYYLWDLIFIWSKLHLRANPSKKDFLEECHQLISLATNVRSIFPFMKIITAELGNEGLHFCMELCAQALQMDLHDDPTASCLIYKTIVYLLPNDLDVCRACALLVFFQERTVESYKTVYLLYTHPDQEYHVDFSPIKNHMRFEILQILKKGLFFDPEFWNLITLRTNCLKLMSEKVMKTALNEIMEEEKWIPDYCEKESHKLHYDSSELYTRKVFQKPVKNKNKPVMRRIVVPPEVTTVSSVKRRGRKPGSRVIKVLDDPQRRCSYRTLDITQENLVKPYGSSYLTRSAGKNAAKRRGRKPHCFQEGSVEEAQNKAPNPVECLDDKTESPSVEDTVLENTTVEMDQGQEITQVQTDTQATCLSVTEVTCEAVQETVLETMPLPDDPSVSCGHGVMVEASLPDNVVSDSHFREQVHQVLEPTSTPELAFSMEVSVGTEEFPVNPLDELQPTSTSQPDFSLEVSAREEEVGDKSLEVLQSTTTSHPDSILEAPAQEEISFQELEEHCEKEGDSAVELLDELKSSALSCADKPNTFWKAAVDVNYATILQLHNYCKIPEEAVEDDFEVINDAPSTLPCDLAESHPECTGCPLEVLVEHNTLRGCTLPEKEIFLQKSPEATVHSICDAGITKPECTVEVFVDAGTFSQGDTVEPGTVEMVVEEIVTDSVIAVADDTLHIHASEKDIPSSYSAAPHNTAGASDNTVTVADNAFVSDGTNHVQINEIAIPNETVIESNASHVPTDMQLSVVGLERKQVQTSTLEETKETVLGSDLEAPLVDGHVKAENPVISHYCKLCNKNFRGGNIILHAVAHLQKDKLKCMFCGKLFNRRLIAKKHVLEHIEKLKITSVHGNGLCEASPYTEPSPPNDKHKNKSATRIAYRISTRQRNVSKELAGPKVSRQISSSRKKKPTTDRQHRISLRKKKVGKVQEDQKMQEKLSNPRKAKSVDSRKIMNENESGKPRHHCPAGGCTKTPFRNESSLLRHAMKLHPVDMKVLEYIFRRRNGKCQFCQREFKSLEHFQHHVKRHEHPLKHACYHFDCTLRFKTRAELRDHMKRHRPLQAQCDFAGCSQHFCHLARLHHHEQKHYLPPQEDHNAGDCNIQAEGKCTATVSEPACESLNRSAKRGVSCPAGNGITNIGEEVVSLGMPEKHDDVHVDRTASNKQLVNGHTKNGDWVAVVSTQSPLKATCPEGQREQETRENNNVNTESNGKPECTTEGQKETSHTAPSYGKTSKKPFMRPPPTAYLDERHTSMPKRRKSSDVLPPSREEENSPSHSTQRQRCTNCFSSFPSAEALQIHLSSSKCKSLFGFDSDDESAW
ncbi:uncharacterized protein [Paramormyrops kingsleyae]|uniref:uncharacterized protein n=1 Tax=Paramormyrops kingsleyae TaxID=1676925 RepID=UPI003B96F167